MAVKRVTRPVECEVKTTDDIETLKASGFEIEDPNKNKMKNLTIITIFLLVSCSKRNYFSIEGIYKFNLDEKYSFCYNLYSYKRILPLTDCGSNQGLGEFSIEKHRLYFMQNNIKELFIDFDSPIGSKKHVKNIGILYKCYIELRDRTIQNDETILHYLIIPDSTNSHHQYFLKEITLSNKSLIKSITLFDRNQDKDISFQVEKSAFAYEPIKTPF